MEITPDHPVYVEGKGWLWAENLVVGDRLRRSDGGMAKVLAVERVKLTEPELVYNFTVKGPHTYFVLEVGVLVHNTGITCARVKSGNPWRDERGRFAKTPDFNKEMGVYTKPDVSKEPDIKGPVNRPIAALDPDTGKPVPLPDELPQSSIYPMQGTANENLYWREVGDEIPVTKAVQKLEQKIDEMGEISRETVEILVFRKTEAMDQWPMNVYKEKYTGDWSRLENNRIYALHTRTNTVVTLADLPENIGVPVRWAGQEEILAKAYQASAVEGGEFVAVPWMGKNKWLDHQGNVVDRPDLNDQLMFYGVYKPDWWSR